MKPDQADFLEESKCICDYPDTCGGTGRLQCEGCGGDFCVCLECKGAGMDIGMECWGCDDCAQAEIDDDLEDEDDWYEDDEEDLDY